MEALGEGSELYLCHISGLVDVLLKDHQGRRVDIDVVLTGQLFSPSEPHVHVTKGQVISVCKGSQLDGKKAPECVTLAQKECLVPPVLMVTLLMNTPHCLNAIGHVLDLVASQNPEADIALPCTATARLACDQTEGRGACFLSSS